MSDNNTPLSLGLCRDCFTPLKSNVSRCSNCGSPRIVKHSEIFDLCIAHIDCDAFYAAVEKRDRPELQDKPVIIGGGRRGVVSTACYIARIKGVRSAMPMFKALKLCPDAVVIRPNMEKYAAIGHKIRKAMESLTPLVEPISIDEAFLDLTGTYKVHNAPPAYTLAKFASHIESEIGISISIGLSYCKFLAKIASDFEKPRGFSIIGKSEAVKFLANKPVSMIWGVGKALNNTLKSDGIEYIGQLQKMEESELIKKYGVMGQRLYKLSHGQDNRGVVKRSTMKSISHETTFNVDYAGYSELTPVLRSLCEKVSARLKTKNIAGRTITLKLKNASFKSITRSKQVDNPTQLADRIFQVALPLLKQELNGTKYRLLGVGVSGFESVERADPLDLIDLKATRRAQAERAMDTIRAKFGEKSLETGYTFGTGNRGKPHKDHNSVDDDENATDTLSHKSG